MRRAINGRGRRGSSASSAACGLFEKGGFRCIRCNQLPSPAVYMVDANKGERINESTLMKSLKYIAAMAAGIVLLGGSFTAQAQDSTTTTKREFRKGGGMSVEQQLERYSKQLDLTDAQKPKVKALLEETSKKRQELSSLTGQERRDKSRALMVEQDKKLKDILTPDQYAKFEKQRDEMRQKGKNNEGGKKKKGA